MNDQLIHRAEARGFISRREILDSGYDDRDIREAKAIGLLTRIGAGLYALCATYDSLSAEKKLVAKSRAVFHRHRGAVVLTHQSAAAIHGMALWNASLEEVHVTRKDSGRGRHEAGVQHHVGTIADADVVEVNGVLVSSPDRCVWELVCGLTTEAGLVTADSALHQRLVTPDSLLETSGPFHTWRGSRSGRLVLSLADARAESPGESRSRYLFWRHALPQPDLQFTVLDERGLLVARTDFAWELYRHLAEFDGRIKFDGTFTPEGFQTVFDEKRREDRARAQGWGLSRVIWKDLRQDNAHTTATRIRHALEQSRSLYGRTIIA
ncbi:hypothetical protein [Aeromicrobium sp. CF3.5]|uniref:hypothetical protein n=1 Tax=Aeromicrobium sp. CF3.5 TaxID=3373078 RepID=UPI003EE64E36